MQIQKVNYNIGSIKRVFSGNKVDNSQNKENKDYNILKESIMEGLLLSGMAFADGDCFRSGEYKNANISKSNPVGDKILFGTMAICIAITTIQLVKAIKHYISDKKNGLA